MRINKGLLQISLGLFFAFAIIQIWFSGKIMFDELALGTETFPYYAKNISNEPVHISRIDNNEEPGFLKSYINCGRPKTIFFLGNSQTHSINQIKNNETNFIQILNDSLLKSSIKIYCQSIPNANLQEFLLSYLYWKDKINIETLVVPLFFDDLREDGIRDVFYPNLIRDRYLIVDSSSQITMKINQNLRSYWTQSLNINLTENEEVNKNNIALKETVQEGVENNLHIYFASNFKSWNHRENVRGEFFVWLYKFRNTVLGIKPSTVRNMIPQKYTDNIEALKLLLNQCKRNKVKVLLYIPPIRTDVPLPYQLNLYSKFKKDIKLICDNEKGNFYFADFDQIIPGYLWGYKESTNLIDKREIDYMHFKYKGHIILADSLYKHLSSIK
jgi:hypothetical protein